MKLLNKILLLINFAAAKSLDKGPRPDLNEENNVKHTDNGEHLSLADDESEKGPDLDEEYDLSVLWMSLMLIGAVLALGNKLKNNDQ